MAMWSKFVVLFTCIAAETFDAATHDICATENCEICWDEAGTADDDTLFVLRPDLYGCDFSRSSSVMNLTMITMPFISPKLAPDYSLRDQHIQENSGQILQLDEPDALERQRDGWAKRLIEEHVDLCNSARGSGGNCHAGLVRSYLRGLLSSCPQFRFNPSAGFVIESGARVSGSAASLLSSTGVTPSPFAVMWVLCDEDALGQVLILS